MIIEGDIYRLTPISDHSSFFDLELLYDIGGKNPRQEFKIVAYGITLEKAIDEISNYALSKKFDKDYVLTLKQYCEELKSIKNDIKEKLP